MRASSLNSVLQPDTLFPSNTPHLISVQHPPSHLRPTPLIRLHCVQAPSPTRGEGRARNRRCIILWVWTRFRLEDSSLAAISMACTNFAGISAPVFPHLPRHLLSCPVSLMGGSVATGLTSEGGGVGLASHTVARSGGKAPKVRSLQFRLLRPSVQGVLSEGT